MTSSVIRYKCTNGSKITLQVLSDTEDEIVGINTQGNTISLLKKYVLDTTVLAHKTMKKRTDTKRNRSSHKSHDVSSIESKPRRLKRGIAQLYLLSLGNDFYKVGYTRKPLTNRIKAFKTISTQPITILKQRDVSNHNVTSEEAYLKQQFRKLFVQSNGGTEVFKVPSSKKAVNLFMQGS